MNPFTRKTLIFVAVILAIGCAGFLGRRIYQKATVHRLTAEAAQYLQKQDLRNASLCLQQALQINPFNVQVNHLMADMLEQAGSPMALNWRIRTAELETNNMEYRLEWAKTAIEMNDFTSAAQALGGVDQQSRSTAQFHKLAGGLAWNLHFPAEAEKQYALALQLEPTNPAVILNLATVRLVSTNKSVASEARATLEAIPATSPLHLMALRALAADAAGRKSYQTAIDYEQRVASDPKAGYGDKLGYLQLLYLTGSPQYGAWQKALEEDATNSPFRVSALGHWMQAEEGPAVALRWLNGLPPNVQTNVPVQMAITECQVGLKDWNGLLKTVGNGEWGEAEYYRLFLNSAADRSLGNNESADTAWQSALMVSSHHLERLVRLNQLTTAWGWGPERKQVLDQIISQFPRETWAPQQLTEFLYAQGQTQELSDLLNKMYSADPSNIPLKHNLAMILLLEKSDLNKAHRLAQEAYQSAPDDPFYACTYAYSLLLQSRNEDAAKIIGTLKPDYLKNPSIAAYYGIVEAQTGNPKAAASALKTAQTAKLLPEELQLVLQAQERL
jgi:cytochrome c-type biogenesis protein CcmH/NrfG